MKSVAVLGGGSYGTALAQHLASVGLQVWLYTRHQQDAQTIQNTHRNPRYLHEFELHPNISATHELETAVLQSDFVLLTTPSHSVRSMCESLKPHIRSKPFIIGAKGIENDSLFTMAEVAIDVWGPDKLDQILAISGPSFAREIMQQHPTAVVIAGYNEALAADIAHVFFCETFRAYTSNDVIGVELGGALKNVMAIAAGAMAGLGYGHNTLAALITRGVAEITRIAVAKGAHPLTLAGLSGVGDLILTCTGHLSRNRTLGYLMAQGQSLEEALQSIKEVAEGVYTTRSAKHMSDQLHVYAPITNAVYRALYEKIPVKTVMQELTQREPGKEITW